MDRIIKTVAHPLFILLRLEYERKKMGKKQRKWPRTLSAILCYRTRFLCPFFYRRTFGGGNIRMIMASTVFHSKFVQMRLWIYAITFCRFSLAILLEVIVPPPSPSFGGKSVFSSFNFARAVVHLYLFLCYWNEWGCLDRQMPTRE